MVEDERAWTSPSACRSRWSRRSNTIMIVPGRRIVLITAVHGLRSTYGTPHPSQDDQRDVAALMAGAGAEEGTDTLPIHR